jgi:GNAT superfamily N-acetyltransferase
MSAETRVRPATAGDYSAFATLFPELSVGDPVPSQERFRAELAATTLIAERSDGSVVGYAYFQSMQSAFYVRNIVVAPAARREGVGRALMRDVAHRARALACTTWCLNVKPENAAAIALYSRCGMLPAFSSQYMRMPWSALANADDSGGSGATIREMDACDDAAVERELSLVPGHLGALRSQKNRVFLVVEMERQPVGAAAFDPTFPGASPFRVREARYAAPLLRGLLRHALPGATFTNLMIEDHPKLAEQLARWGATVTIELLHMRGAVPRDASV